MNLGTGIGAGVGNVVDVRAVIGVANGVHLSGGEALL